MLTRRTEISQSRERERTAAAYAGHPALLCMLELETLRDFGKNGNARIYIGFDKHAQGNGVPAAGLNESTLQKETKGTKAFQQEETEGTERFGGKSKMKNSK